MARQSRQLEDKRMRYKCSPSAANLLHFLNDQIQNYPRLGDNLSLPKDANEGTLFKLCKQVGVLGVHFTVCVHKSVLQKTPSSVH